MITPKFSILIVEDAPLINQLIADKLEEMFPNQFSISQCYNASDAIRFIDNNKPDMAFLDVELPDNDSFFILETVRFKDFKRVFVTAYDNFALKAIKHDAAEYLLKPINFQELRDIVNRLLKQIHAEKIMDIIETKGQDDEMSRDYLKVKTRSKLYYIFYNSILYIKSDNVYTTIYYLKGGVQHSVQSSIAICKLEKMLPLNSFYRIHNRYIVNKAQIRHVSSTNVLLNHDVELPASRNRVKLLNTVISA